jgi:3-oxoacyl-[acyl-carrier protein] reductase
VPGLLEGRVALVTGAGRGIGRTVAFALAEAGASVAVVARTADEVRATSEEIQSTHRRRSAAIVADVATPAEARRAVATCARRLGPPLILVNAAAVQGPIGRFDGNDLLEWTRCVRVNLLGAAMVIQAALAHMLQAKRGKIINVSGGGAASPRPHFTAYACSKAGLVRLTETLAHEFQGDNIQVNALAPGATRTRMTREVLDAGGAAGKAARAEAEEIWRTGGTDPKRQAALAVFLASDESSHVTGRLLHVNDPWEGLRASSTVPEGLYTLRRVSPAPVAAETP